MKRDSKRSVAMIVAIMLVMQLVMPSFMAVTFAETKNSLTVSLNEIVTGTAPFNTTNQIGEGYYPGDDYSATDQYVRTLDSVAYTIDYGVNPAGTTANNVVLKANLSGSDAITWDANLEILYSGLTISADGKDITYNLGNVSGGNAYSFSPVLKVDGTALNGEIFHLDVTLSSDNIDPVTVKSEDIIISASPKFDLAIDTYSKKSVKNASNELGTVIYSTIEVLMNDGKGSEYLTGDLNFTVDLSKIRALGINPEIYDSADANEEAVERHGDSSYIHWYGKMPWGNRDGNSESSVVDTATFNATQAAVGEDINITVSNADLSGNHLPSKNADGSTVALDENYVVAGTLAIWIPAMQTPETDTTIEIGYKNFDPDSISGQSNYKTEVEPMHNNQSSIIIKRPTSASGASKSYYYGDVWYSYEDGEKLYGETNKFDNTGLLLRGETFDTRLKFGIASDGAHTNVASVVKLDSDIELVADGAGIAHSIEAVNGLPASEVIVEYGVGEYTDWLDMRECEGEDADSLGAWYTDVNSAPSEITKIRVRTRSGEMPSNSNIYVIFKTKVKDTATLNAELPVFLSYKTDMKDSGRWRHSYYDLDTGLPNSEYRSDNANVTGVKSQIEIEIDKVSEQVGNKVNITLESSLTAKGKTGNANDVVIEVDLPSGLEYRFGSAKENGSNSSDPIIKRNSDNSQTLTWNLGEKEINAVMDSYSFDADISYEIASLSDLAVVAVISTPLDVSKESLRTSQDSIIITNTSAWGISKSVDSPIVEVGEDLKYTLKYFQFRNEALKNFEFIDVLPYIGDARTPASNFHGSYSLKSINVTNGETYMVTNADPSTINIDPNVGGTPWFAYGDIANDEVTAIKIFSSSYPHTEPTRTIDIILTPVGNQKNDVYTNIFSGRTEDILALVESNDVSISVIASSISGTIWEDTDSDGSIDPAEDRLSNVSVALFDNLDKEVSLGVTNADGTYIFENIPSGEYKVKIKNIASDYEETFEYDGSLNEVVTVDLAKDIRMTGIDFGYQKRKGTLIVNHLEQGTNKVLAAREELEDIVGTAYATSKKVIADYDYISVDNAEIGNIIDGTITVNYYYEKKAIIKKGNVVVIHKNGTTILKQETLGEEIPGTVYTTSPLTGAEYDKYVVATPGNKDGIYTDGTIEVIYLYVLKTPIPPVDKMGNLVINYLEQGSNKVIAPQLVSIDKVGEVYNASSKLIDGYTYVNVDGLETGNYIDGVTTINYYYVRQTGNLIVNHLEKGTNNVLFPQENSTDNVGASYITSKKIIENYDFDSVDALENGEYVDGTITVNYYYTKKMGTLIVRYLELNTNNVLSNEVIMVDTVGESYKVTSKDIDDYNLSVQATNETGEYIDGSVVVTYYYTKKDKPKKNKPKKDKPKREEPEEKPEPEDPDVTPEPEDPDVTPEPEDPEVTPEQKEPESSPDTEEVVEEVEEEILFDIEDEEIPQGTTNIERKVLPQTGFKVPYSSYFLGAIIIIFGLAIRFRK